MIARCLVVGAGGFLGAIARYAVGSTLEISMPAVLASAVRRDAV